MSVLSTWALQEFEIRAYCLLTEEHKYRGEMKKMGVQMDIQSSFYFLINLCLFLFCDVCSYINM